MNTIKELKLAIYESSLDTDDKEDLLNIVESTDDEDILCDVVDILEATKEKADGAASLGEYIRQSSKKRVEEELNDDTYDDLDYVKRRKDALKSGKYGSQYEKMSPEEQRRRNIRQSYHNIGHNTRGVKKQRGKKNIYDRRSRLILFDSQSDIEDSINDIKEKIKHNDELQKKNRDKRDELLKRDYYSKQRRNEKVFDKINSSYDKAQNTLREKQNKNFAKEQEMFTKGQIINDMKRKYRKNPEKLEKLAKIREKHGHKLESVLEAYKDGYFSEAEVLEILSEE